MDHATFAQLLGNYGEFIGSIAVVATLGYLAVQIRQQNRESRQAAMRAIAQGWREAIGHAGDPDIADFTMRGIEDFNSLAPGEQWVLMSRVLNVLRVGEEAYMLLSDGRLDDRYWQGISRYLAQVVSFSGVRQMWELRKHYYHDEYQSLIDRMIDSSERVWRTYTESLASKRV